MKAVVYKGPFRVAVEDVPDPRIEKRQSMGTGQCRVKRYNEHLRDLIIAGRATPSLLVSHAVSLTRRRTLTTSSTSGPMATPRSCCTRRPRDRRLVTSGPGVSG